MAITGPDQSITIPGATVVPGCVRYKCVPDTVQRKLKTSRLFLFSFLLSSSFALGRVRWSLTIFIGKTGKLSYRSPRYDHHLPLLITVHSHNLHRLTHSRFCSPSGFLFISTSFPPPTPFLRSLSLSLFLSLLPLSSPGVDTLISQVIH
jgi:hypothetical protein